MVRSLVKQLDRAALVVVVAAFLALGFLPWTIEDSSEFLPDPRGAERIDGALSVSCEARADVSGDRVWRYPSLWHAEAGDHHEIELWCQAGETTSVRIRGATLELDGQPRPCLMVPAADTWQHDGWCSAHPVLGCRFNTYMTIAADVHRLKLRVELDVRTPDTTRVAVFSFEFTRESWREFGLSF